jgi:hypothetical protein
LPHSAVKAARHWLPCLLHFFLAFLPAFPAEALSGAALGVATAPLRASSEVRRETASAAWRTNTSKLPPFIYFSRRSIEQRLDNRLAVQHVARAMTIGLKPLRRNPPGSVSGIDNSGDRSK